jgi:DNA-binding transcriptional LysR family regulator
MADSIGKLDQLSGVEVRHLAALEAVIETGSFAVAGRKLGYAQSSISQQVATLERAAGMRLLERPGGRRAVTPTEAGERLLRHARRAVAAMRAAEADLVALAEGEAGTLRVGTFQSAGVRLLPEVWRRYVDRWPRIEMRLTEAAYDEELVEQLVGGELELAFVNRPTDTALEHVAVLSDPYVLLAPAASDLAADGGAVRIRDVASLPLVAYRRPSDGGEAYLVARGLEARVVFRSDESGTVQGLVGAGIGYALVPRLTVDHTDRTVVALGVTGVPPREITLAWHADRTLTSAARAFVQVVEEVVADTLAT